MVVEHDGVPGEPGGEASCPPLSRLAEDLSWRLLPRSEATRIRKSWLKMLSSLFSLPGTPLCGGGLSSVSPNNSNELHFANELVSFVSNRSQALC